MATARSIGAKLLALALLATGTGVSWSGEYNLAGTEWRALTIAGEEVPTGASMFVHFRAEGELFGNAGCNYFYGRYETNGDGLEISHLAVTRKACPDPVMQLENAFLDTLEASRRYQREPAPMKFFDENGDQLATLAWTNWD
jgi:heat shock protein HslJ